MLIVSIIVLQYDYKSHYILFNVININSIIMYYNMIMIYYIL